jgi:hypothetical protein
MMDDKSKKYMYRLNFRVVSGIMTSLTYVTPLKREAFDALDHL